MRGELVKGGINEGGNCDRGELGEGGMNQRGKGGGDNMEGGNAG